MKSPLVELPGFDVHDEELLVDEELSQVAEVLHIAMVLHVLELSGICCGACGAVELGV